MEKTKFDNVFNKNVTVQKYEYFTLVQVDETTHFSVKKDQTNNKYIASGVSEYCEGLETDFFNTEKEAINEILKIAIILADKF